MTDRAFHLLTLQLATRLTLVLREIQWPAVVLSEHAQLLAERLRNEGIGLVDIARHRAWIDERVHEGVLIRLRDAEARVMALQDELAQVSGLAREMTTADRETADIRPPAAEEAPADYEAAAGTSAAIPSCGGVGSRHAGEKISATGSARSPATCPSHPSTIEARVRPAAGVAPGPHDPNADGMDMPPFLDRRQANG